MQTSKLDRSASHVVLIVDDVPNNLSMLHDALEEFGYTVLVATNGEDALSRSRQTLPDIILLDALMPGMDGFEVSRRLKADYSTQHIPIIFMTGLTETEHVVAAFAAGGTDYVAKPIRPPEVLARIPTHLQNTRQMRQARSALDAFGQATFAINASDHRLVWQTALARKLLNDYFPVQPPQHEVKIPAPVQTWISEVTTSATKNRSPAPLQIIQGARKLIFALHHETNENEWLVVMHEESDAAVIDALMLAFSLTQREAEVLYWVIKGKTNRDIGDILGTSPRTVNKHLEHVFEKLGVETRTAAAAKAIGKVRAIGAVVDAV